jgi:DNA polymerase III delta prime subunit
MAINSTLFGPTIISGDEAKAFNHFIKFGRASQASIRAAQAGREMLEQFEKNGVVSFSINSIKQK